VCPLQLPGTYAGGSLDLDETGNNLVIGAYKANTNRGAVYVYQRTATRGHSAVRRCRA
jgi:hypothetical protein